MALIEVNLKKPAIVEERPGSGESSAGRRSARAKPTSGGGGTGKLVGLLAVLFGVGLVVIKMRGSDDTEMETDVETESTYEPVEPESESGGARKLAGALGLVVAVASVAVAARKRRR